jgi:amino acid transporter
MWSATAVVIGAIIGTGIFLVTSEMARDLGSGPRVLAVWILGGVVALLGTFCYAELGGAMPDAGGDYVYLSRGLGPMWGFLFGWMNAVVERPAGQAALAAGVLRFTAFLLPAVATPIFAWMVPFGGAKHHLIVTAAQPLAAAVVVVLAGINFFGVRTAGRVQIALTSLKVAAVLAIVVLGLASGNATGGHAASLPTLPASGTLGGVLTALVSVMWAYNGFSHLGLVGGEVTNPQRTLPRAAILAVVSVMALYTAVNWVYFHVLGFPQVAGSSHVASDTVRVLAGPTSAKWLTIAMIVSAIGAIHVGFLTGPRVIYAMAHDGRFFSFTNHVHPVFRTPSGAIAFQGSLTALLALTGTFEELYSLAIFAIWLFFALTAFAMIQLRRKEPALPRPYRAWGYPWSPLIFGAAALAMTANLWLVRPLRSSMGLVVIALGIPLFHYWRRRALGGPAVEAIARDGAAD